MEGLAVGQRACYRGSYGTIRYIGQVKGDDIWVGLEWDTNKGKNSGDVDGVQYFTCKKEGQGSFVKLQTFLEASIKPCSLLESAMSKYADRRENDLSEMYITTVRNAKKVIELVGADKVLSHQEKIYALNEIALQESGVATIDASLGEMLASCMTLLLDQNLLNSWDQAVSVLGQLPDLYTLSLSYNRLEQPLSQPFSHNLHTLVLIDMGMSWRDLVPILEGLPLLEELLFCKNNCSNIEGVSANLLPCLKVLNLEQTGITSWDMVAASFADLPLLERLILNKNQLSSMSYTGGFPRLESLSLETNGLEDLRSITEIGKFQSGVRELRLAGNDALAVGLSTSMFRFTVIARISSLTQLNGAQVRNQERTDAERFYLRSNLENDLERASDLWARLVAKHGDPAEIGRLVSSAEALASQTVTSNTVNVLLRSLTASSAGQEARKRLSLTLKVGDLRNMVRKLFRLTSDFKLTYRESKETIMPEQLEDNLKDLGYYFMKDGGEVWVEDLE
mmetsp:Transcript_17305/g.31175  ORF Transcript_17305/g.31175 Transcript_17305/m.31175 type:complete len:507 (-) Transcript_17305:8907-10427(-)